MPFELTEQGLFTQTEQEIADEMGAKVRGTFGPNMKTSASSNMGQTINIVSEGRSVDQQTALAVYNSMDPDKAKGVSLDRILTLTGSTRQGALSSEVNGLATFTGPGTLLNGHIIHNDDNDTDWQLINGPVVSAAGGTEPATFQAVETGPTLANSPTTWSNVTTAVNFVGFTNPTDDAERGRDRESDSDARQRRNIEVFSQGSGPINPIRAAVSSLSFVLDALVNHNPSVNPVDAFGVPFKAFHVIAHTSPLIPTAAQQQEVWSAIFSAMGAGGLAHGTDYIGTHVDTEGTAHTMAFDGVTAADIVIEIDLITSTAEKATTNNIVTVVADEVISFAQANFEKVGRDVTRLDIDGIVKAMLVAETIAGVDGVDVRLAVDPASPTAVTKLSIARDQIPDFDSGNITVIEV